jgi:hypothetical protein
MNRYRFAEEGKRYDGKRMQRTVIFPKIAVDETDVYITSNDMMYFDTLAHKYYGDISLWWIIAAANHMCNGRLSVSPGKQLRIPMNITRILNDIQASNK